MEQATIPNLVTRRNYSELEKRAVTPKVEAQRIRGNMDGF